MILLVGKPSYCTSLDRVADWLWHFKADFLRVNGADFIQDCDITLGPHNTIIKIGGREIDLSSISVVWFRRFFSYSDFKSLFFSETTGITKQLNHALKQEQRSLLYYIVNKLRPKAFNYAAIDEINKLMVLEEARNVGLLIPHTMVSPSCNQKGKKKFIAKAISNSFTFHFNKKTFSGYTSRVNHDPEIACRFPSLFQIEIEKEFEIRSFVLEDSVYSMAMFTQANHKTSVDFRKYDMANPTRCIPYNLPSETENKLVQLFKNLNLKMGSVDLIKCKSTNEIYFLEINPEGQYDMVSSNCNYNLHEKIALKLINIDNEFKR